MFRATAGRGRDAALAHYFDQPVTVHQCDVMSDALAVDLQRRGVEPGDRVAMYLQNIPQVLITVLAAWKCGAVIVPCNPMLRERELAKILSDSGSRVLVCQEDLYAEVARTTLPSTAVQHTITTSPLDFLPADAPLPPVLAGVDARAPPGRAGPARASCTGITACRPSRWRSRGDDVAFMVYTSGTTGAPKAAMNTHRNVVFATSVYERWIGLTQADMILGLAPLFHVTGLIGHVTLAMLTGSPLVLFYRFDAGEACQLAQRHRATFTVSAVTAFIALLNSDAMKSADLSSLTKVYTGGAPTPPGVLAEWHERTGVRIQPMYGLTEATSPTHMTPHGAVPPVDPRTGAMSVGVPVFNTDVRIVTDTGADAGPREIGELLIRGPQIIPAYWQKPEETAKSLRGGELRTGDVGFLDEHGWFYLVDRAKDMIVASGFKVWPREVEEVLYLHPAVREAAVIGVPDPYRGETIKAVISLKPGCQVSEHEIKAFARERMAAYKYPRFVEIIDELPKTTSGKIMRRLLQTTTREARRRCAAPSWRRCRTRSCARRSRRARCSKSAPTWLRLSRGSVSRSTAERLYERLHDDDVAARRGRTVRRPRRVPRRQRGLSRGGGRRWPRTSTCRRASSGCGCASCWRRRSRTRDSTPENVISAHEHVTDSIAAGDTKGAVKAILSWGQTSRASVQEIVGGDAENGSGELPPIRVVDEVPVGRGEGAGKPGRRRGRAGLRARRPRRHRDRHHAGARRLAGDRGGARRAGRRGCARSRRSSAARRRRTWRATSAPRIRSTASSSACCATRSLFEIYNAMDLPELMRRVLEVAPVSIREVFDDHKAWTDALRSGDVDATCAAMTAKANRVRAALATLLVDPQAAGGTAAVA